MEKPISSTLTPEKDCEHKVEAVAMPYDDVHRTMMVALHAARQGRYDLRVLLPKSGILFLQGHKMNRKDMNIEIMSPEQESLFLNVQAMYLM